MGITVEAVCDAMDRCRLMPSDDVAALRQRWFKPSRDGVADLERFRKWIISNHFVTEYQARLLVEGQADNLYLDRYKVIDRVTKGRLAGDIKAVDGKGKLFLLKILSAARTRDPDWQARFQQDAKRVLQLNHPNLLRAVDAGLAHGQYYIAYEYAEGESLAETLERKGKLPYLQAARMMAHAFQALQQIHEQGMVHGDLKPSNILLAVNPSAERKGSPKAVRVLEAGLTPGLFQESVAASGAAGYDLVPTTMEADISGDALEYAALEKVRDSKSADIRSDIFSLGCIFYECLTGKGPFKGVNVLQRASYTPQPLRELAPDVPEMLEQMIEQMMAADPAERYQTPARAAKALRVFLSSEEEAHAKAQEEAANADILQEVVPVEAPRRERPAEDRIKQREVEALWDDIRPKDRDFIYMGIGMTIIVVLGGGLAFAMGHKLGYLLFFALGAVASPIAERLIAWYRSRRENAGVTEW